MLTESQESKHWREWGNVVRENDWRMVDGRLSEDAIVTVRSAWHRRVWAHANVLAIGAHRATTPDDLRHACYWVALGKPKSHKKFDNRDFDRVLALFKLLINPEDLSAGMAQNDYERGGDPGGYSRLIYAIEHKAPPAYIEAISLDKYGTRDWKSLNGQQLFRLNMTLSNRRAAWRKPVQQRARELDPANSPF